MKKLLQFAWCAVLVVSAIFAEPSWQSDLAHPSENQSTHVRVYSPGDGVTAPDLLPTGPLSEAIFPCELKVDGNVYLSFLVDTGGFPHNLTFIQPTGSDLDELALRIVSEDRFKPGTSGGVPVVVAQSVQVILHTCLLTVEAETGEKAHKLRLRSQPEQRFAAMQNPPKEASFTSDEAFDTARNSYKRRVGGNVIAPVPVHTLEVKMLNVRRKLRFRQSCLVSVIIDSHGMPIEPKVLRGINPALDLEALEAVGSRRFHPATENGRPVAVRLVMEVNFAFY